MVDQVIENNQVIMAGEIVSEFVFSHEVFGGRFLHAGDQCPAAEQFL